MKNIIHVPELESTKLEIQLRILGTDLIESMSILLKQPRSVAATAQTLYIRFYSLKSYSNFSLQDIVLASVFLASKIEESQRSIKDIINVYWFHVNSKRSINDRYKFSESNYYSCKESMLIAEKDILSCLGFKVHVKHSFVYLLNYVKALDQDSNTKLLQLAWNYISASLRTTLVVLYQPEDIACGALFLAARNLNVELPIDWWLVFDAFYIDLVDISDVILKLFDYQIDYQLPITIHEMEIYNKTGNIYN